MSRRPSASSSCTIQVHVLNREEWTHDSEITLFEGQTKTVDSRDYNKRDGATATTIMLIRSEPVEMDPFIFVHKDPVMVSVKEGEVSWIRVRADGQPLEESSTVQE